MALEFERLLGLPAQQIEVRIAEGKLVESSGTSITQLNASDGQLTFLQRDTRLPTPDSHLEQIRNHPMRVGIRLQVAGLPAGNYVLRSQGKDIHAASAEQWAQGIRLETHTAARAGGEASGLDRPQK